MDTLELPVTPVAAATVEADGRTGRRRQPGPRYRAPSALRAFIGLIGVAAGVFTVGLMLSDHAPGMLRSMFGDTVDRLWERIDADQRELLTSRGVPETDAVVHVLIWAVVAGLVALTLWTWRGLLAGAVLVFTASIAIELAQGVWSTTRSVESGDVVANGIGVAVGTALAGLVLLAWNTAGHLAARMRRC